jgi:hypothetical protein
VEWRVTRCPCEKKGGMGEKGGRRRLFNDVAEGGMEKGGVRFHVHHAAEGMGRGLRLDRQAATDRLTMARLWHFQTGDMGGG